ncbi:MAG: T9SS type A sorting domain-containing protein [Cytophagales bacterium]|nr:T9SS type A sorting domain-containing protein [Cytophagales bacterium]
MTVDSAVVYINDSAVVDTITLSIDTVCSDTTFPVCPDILIISIDSTYDTTYVYTYDTTWIFAYFSFFWQAGGVDANLNPDPSDSIWLEFLAKDSTWNWVWGKKGNAINVGDSIALDFKQEFIAITDNNLAYFHKGFQFKFQSFGRLSGNYDVWHIDYVYLYTNDTLNDDFAFSNSPTSFLSRYSAMPHNQYFVDNSTKSAETADIISVTTNNLRKQQLSMDVLCELSISNESSIDSLIDIILDTTYFTPNQCPNKQYQQCQLNALPDENKLTDFNSALKIKYKFKIESDSTFTSNDTISGFTILDNYYAYDDGSAEYGIGINVPFGRAAYRFILNEPDTLTEIQMYFTQLGENHNGKTFKLMVWKHIDTVNAANDDTLYSKDVQILYQGSINKFDSYKIDSLIWDGIVSDTFYVGWMQYTNDILNIGFDKNTNTNQHIFYNVAGQWIRYDLSEGSMMIRPVFGESGFATAIPEYKTINRSIKIYPNPSDGVVYISAINSPSLQGWVYVYDIKGKLIVMQNLLHNNNSHQIDLSGYPDGMYFLKFAGKNLNVNKKLILIK